MTDMTPAELLEKAADDIARYGHHKESYFDTSGRVDTAPTCAYGALTRAATDGLTANYAGIPATFLIDRRTEGVKAWYLVSQAAELLARSLKPGNFDSLQTFHIVTTFNDKDTTQASDVVRQMKEAASMADIGEEITHIEFEPLPESVPETAPAAPVQPAEPVPA
jgi:hypothetical protein